MKLKQLAGAVYCTCYSAYHQESVITLIQGSYAAKKHSAAAHTIWDQILGANSSFLWLQEEEAAKLG